MSGNPRKITDRRLNSNRKAFMEQATGNGTGKNTLPAPKIKKRFK